MSALAVAAFAAGCLVQLAMLTWGAWSRRQLWALLIVPAGWLLAVANDVEPLTAAFGAILGLVLAWATMFRDQVLPVMGGHTLLVGLLPWWPLWIDAGTPAALLVILIPISVLVFALVTSRWRINTKWRIVATVLAILQTVLLVGWHFDFRSLSFFFGGPAPPHLAMLASGLLFAFLAAYLAQVYAILRPPATQHADSDTPEARHAHLEFLAQRFQNPHIGTTRVLLVLLLFAIYWAAGHTLQASNAFLLWPWLALVPYLLRTRTTLPTQSATRFPTEPATR